MSQSALGVMACSNPDQILQYDPPFIEKICKYSYKLLQYFSLLYQKHVFFNWLEKGRYIYMGHGQEADTSIGQGSEVYLDGTGKGG